MHEHQTNGTGANDHHRVARSGCRFLETTNDTGQRLGERRMLKGNPVRDQKGVLLNDPCGDANIFCVSAVIEEKVLAKILLPAKAEKTPVARGRVQGNDAVPRAKICDPGAHLGYGSRHLVSEWDRRFQHHGVITTPVNLQIGSTGKGRSDTYDQFALLCARGRDLLQTQVFLSVEDRRDHLLIHPYYLLIPRGLFPILIRNY